MSAASDPGSSVVVTAGSSGGRMLHWAVRLLQVQATATGLLTIVAIWAAAAGPHVSLSSQIATPATAAVGTAILAGLAVALDRRKALARGPAIVLEMLLIPMGYYMIVAGQAWLGVPTMVLGLAGAVCLLAPSTRTALGLN